MLHSYRPYLTPLLIGEHRRQRHYWCIVFSDKFRFYLESHDGRQRVRRRGGERRTLQHSMECHVARTVISALEVGLLVFIQGTVTAERYTLAALRHEVGVAWDSVSQEEIDNLLGSMPRRVQERISQRGGSTHY
ncbi:hypothetical protein BDFB_012519 [Asbolus verrucosus]|uniref:Uncharacterized protein n=1 Tax=Asbolus verrucosus TaxID=1661398 RepID=A0A482V8E0_ASBVE|nr:hypothetical protein BDFB_012519 [Asbolus verrucosus]